MKKMLVSLLLLLSAAAVNADTVGWMYNNGGGKIILTDKDCSWDSRQFMAYASSNSISTQFGCWFSDDVMVHITWENSKNFKSYPLEDWTINPEIARRLRQKLKGNSGGYKY